MPNVCLLPDRDCFINESQPNTTFNLGYLLTDVLYSDGSKIEHCRTLMHFTIPPEVKLAEVYMAILSVYFSPGTTTGGNVRIQRVTTTWSEDATWKLSGYGNWTSPGGDFSTPAQDYTSPTSQKWWDLDVTAFVIDAITNRSNSLDLGFLLVNETPGVNVVCSWSSKDQAAAKMWARPFLNIIRPPFGMPMEV